MPRGKIIKLLAMKKISICLMAVIFIAQAALLAAQENNAVKQEVIPEGMEKVQIGNLHLVLPKGAKYKKEGSLITVESPHEYVARLMQGIEARLAKVEATQKELQVKVEAISKTLNTPTAGDLAVIPSQPHPSKK
jgi:hypothetical protein